MKPSCIIIGGGCSGTLAAIQLLRAQCAVTIIERRAAVGPGLAYTVPSDRCTLNVAADAMGIDPAHPEGFFEWLTQRTPNVHPKDFVSRRLFGSYLHDQLQAAAAAIRTNDGVGPASLTMIHDEATDVQFNQVTNRFEVSLERTGVVTGDLCIVAIGNVARTRVNGQEVSAPLFSDPYQESSYQHLDRARQVCIIGTGLTAVDCVLETEGHGFKGQYTLLSRHGHLPLRHESHHKQAEGAAAPPPQYTVPPHLAPPLRPAQSFLELFRSIRNECSRVGSSQPVLTALRPHIQEIWAALTTVQRRQFLRHVRPVWDIHRHRIPPRHADLLSSLIASGRLHVAAGRLELVRMHALTEKHDPAVPREVWYQERGGGRRVGQYDAVFLCAGPESDVRAMKLPVVRNLCARGWLCPGELGLGARINTDTLPPGAIGRIAILGPLQREDLWEITAVREIRLEAKRLAQQLMARLARRAGEPQPTVGS